MKTSLLLFALMLTCCFACETSSDVKAERNGVCSPVQLTSNLDAPTGLDLFTIQSTQLSDHILTISFAYGGGCDPNHAFALYVDPSRQEDSKGVYREGRIVFTTQNPCKRLDYQDFCFDLSTLTKEVPSGRLRIRGTEQEIKF